ncbi:MAG: extracellular solute-binding protein [Clostridia bacterium]|nr:extracellular solute-binding protein [Clostridia bacterium]
MKRMLAFVAALVLVVALVPAYGVYAAETDIGTETEPQTDATIIETPDASYEAYLSALPSLEQAQTGVEAAVNAVLGKDPVTITVEVPVDGLYSIGMEYKATERKTAPIEVALKVDDNVPYEALNALEFPRMWTNTGEVKTDGQGNQIPLEQIPYEGFYRNIALNTSGWNADPYLISLTAGTHTVTITPVSGNFELKTFFFGGEDAVSSYEEPADTGKYYDGDMVVLEGEAADLTNSFWITVKSDVTSPEVTPHDAEKNVLNYVGGNWKTSGDTVIWKTPKLKAGYYQVGFSFRQNTVIGSSSYRALKIDGKLPFAEAGEVAFPYDNGWQRQFFADKENNNTPYLVYLDEGEHEISLTVTQGTMSDITSLLRDAVSVLGDLYMDIVMITGESVDMYRDYELFKQIPDMESRINDSIEKLNESLVLLEKASGSTTGSHAGVIKTMIQVLDQMLKNKFTAHRYKSNYYSSYCSLSATLSEMRSMPLDIDQIYLTKPGDKLPKKTGFFSSMAFSIHRLAASFYLDYNNVSGAAEGQQSIDIWVNWGQDQAQVLNSLNQTFTEKTGIAVNLKIVNATIVQAVLSGKGPNVILQHNRSEPVNLAMRGVLRDLSSFSDCNEVLERFMPGAEDPYYYKDKLYALPDTQNFYMMFIRTDIFKQFGLEIPKTWEEFEEVTKILARNNLDASIPYLQIASTTATNAGVGSLSLFPSLVMQRGLSLYAEDGKSTTLSTPEIIQTFTDWTDFYTKLKIPVTVDFYNRFRTGTCPMGVAVYSTYNTLKATAPEIEGMWTMVPIPGTVQKDGTINQASTGGGTSCSILKSTPEKEEAAWEYLKWWTDTETQTNYSMTVESILGPTGRIAISNTEAMLDGLSWEDDAADQLRTAWSQVKEVPEVPGSYYIARSIDHCFWNVVNSGKIPKDMLNKWGLEVDSEIERKWKQYENR